MPENSETWLPIPGFENHYEVSNQGRVRSLERAVTSHSDNRRRVFKGRVLKQGSRKNGYCVVGLSKDGVVHDWYVHRLVLWAFVGAPPPGAECCHNNDVRDDNRLENLRWGTHKANVGDAVARGRHRNPQADENRQKTHCHRGHPYDEANTIVRPEGRGCRECIRMNERARYHRNGGTLPVDDPYLRYMTYCHRGHLLDDANFYIRPNGKWNCRACRRITGNARYRRRQQTRRHQEQHDPDAEIA